MRALIVMLQVSQYGDLAISIDDVWKGMLVEKVGVIEREVEFSCN